MDHGAAMWELEQIKRLKARYYRLQDQNRWDDWGELFTADCEIADPIDPSITLYGRKAIVERTAELAAGSRRAHRGTMPDLELLDEQTATGTWALHCAAQFQGQSGPAVVFIYRYYTDEYVKDRDGQWRIHRMEYINDMTVADSGAPQPDL